MNKSDAIQRIVQMQNLIDRASTPEHEKTVAQEMIVRLKAQFELDERSIQRAIDIEAAGGADATGFGGHKIWFYEQRIQPHLDTIKAEINTALALIAKEDTKERVRQLCNLYDDLRGLVEAGAKNSYKSSPVQQLRNEAVRELYAEELAKLDNTYSRQSKHQFAVMYTKFSNDLTTAQVESIVGVHSDDHIWEEMEADLVTEAKEAGCTCPHPYFKGKRTKKRITEGRYRTGTQYLPRELQHAMQCPLSPHHAYYLQQQAQKQQAQD